MIEKNERIRYIALLCILLAILIASFFVDGVKKSIADFITIQRSSSRLIQDFTVIGIGGALLNASLVALIGLCLVFFSSVSLAGPTIAAIFTLLGFGFFGKTPLNGLPIMAGVWVAARIARQTLGSYSLIALFGTALGPMVTYLMFETALPLSLSIPIACIAGLATGIILPAIAGTMLQQHHGYNLYNIGFSCGFIGLFVSSTLRVMKQMQPISIQWNEQGHPVLTALIPAVAMLLCSVGLISSNDSFKILFLDTRELQHLSGRLPTDYFDAVNSGAPWLNMGLLAFASFLFVLITGAPFNGPVIGGIFTVIGFGAFGKSLKNCWPIVLGVCLGILLFRKEFTDPGPILAALFATTLAPIAGQFGILAGIIAGLIHFIMVESTAAWHGGLDLYNNGFAGGLTATFIITILHWFQTNRSKEDFKL